MRETVNGRLAATGLDDIKVELFRHNAPPVINGLLPLGVNINGWTREPVLPACVMNVPLYHTACSVPTGGSFKSLDKNALMGAVTGAIWTPQGRSFDGLDDKIEYGTTAVLNLTGTVAVEVCFKLNASALCDGRYEPVALGTTATSFQVELGNVAASGVSGRVGVLLPGFGPACYNNADNIFVLGKWHHLVIVKTGAASYLIVLDGVSLPLGVSANYALSISGTKCIGHRADATEWFPGIIKFARVYSLLTLAQSINLYRESNWRWQ